MMYTLGPTAIQQLGRRQFLALYLLGGAFSQRKIATRFCFLRPLSLLSFTQIVFFLQIDELFGGGGGGVVFFLSVNDERLHRILFVCMRPHALALFKSTFWPFLLLRISFRRLGFCLRGREGPVELLVPGCMYPTCLSLRCLRARHISRCRLLRALTDLATGRAGRLFRQSYVERLYVRTC